MRTRKKPPPTVSDHLGLAVAVLTGTPSVVPAQTTTAGAPPPVPQAQSGAPASTLDDEEAEENE